MENKYSGVKFFAEKASARKSSNLAGTVLVVDHKQVNGVCFAAVGVRTGDTSGLPVKTWVNPVYLARNCVEVTEAEARKIHPALFKALEAYDRAPEYRFMYAIESKRSPLQNATMTGKWVGDHFYRIYGN